MASPSSRAARPTCSRSSACRTRSSRARSSTTARASSRSCATAPSERWCVLLVNRRTARIFVGTARRRWRRSTRSRTTCTASTTRAAGRRRTTSARSSRRSSTTSATRSTTLFARFKRQPLRPPGRRRARGAGRRGRGAAAPVPARAARRPARHRRRELRAPTPCRRPRPRSSSATSRREREALDRMHAGHRPRRPRRRRAPTPVMEALEQARVEILLLADDFDAPELDERAREGDHAVGRGAGGPPPRRPRDARRDRRRASLLSVPRALVIVDFQNDFTPGGALAVPRRRRDRRAHRRLARSGEYDLVVATRDWHPPDHGSFAAQGGPWPEHCVQGTPGAELHPALDRALVDVVVDKGQDPRDRGLLRLRGDAASPSCCASAAIDHVTVVGLATDYCVRTPRSTRCATASASRSTRPRCGRWRSSPATAQRALEEVRAAGGEHRLATGR